MIARALALFRIALGIAVGALLVGWLSEFELFLSDSGPVSLSALAVGWLTLSLARYAL